MGAIYVLKHAVFVLLSLCVLFVFFVTPINVKPVNAAPLMSQNIPNGDFYDRARDRASPATVPEPLILVAHAAGTLDGYAGSNSLEALRHSAALGHSYIEVDMITTSDGYIVLNHSWEHVSNRIPGIEDGIMSYEDFMGQRIHNRFSPTDLDMLIKFMAENPEIRIITDTKETDYAALYEIAERFPEYRDRFIAQVYHFDNVARIRSLGFDDIMIGVYLMPYEMRRQAAEINRLALLHDVFAVSVPDVLLTAEYLAQLDTGRMRFISHNVECLSRARELREHGFYGIYSAFLAYSTNSPIPRLRVSPIPAYKMRLKSNISAIKGATDSATESRQHNTLSALILYQINTPVYLHKGIVTSVRTDAVAAPFISPLNDMLYLPARHFFRYSTGHEWLAEERLLHLSIAGNYGEEIHFTLKGEDHDLFLYRDMVFLSESAIAEIFSYRILRQNSYIALIPKQNSFSEAYLIELTKQVFQR